ncbi:MAG: hypothetical protein IJV17_06015 [Prevotella sp.]|nr:hypothetical protein [Prevotella sp.]
MKKIFTLIAMAIMAVGAQAQTWNFKGTVAQTDSYSSDETHWAWADNRWNYLLATNNEALMLGSEELALTKGLKFKAGAANDNKQGKIRVSTNLQLNGKDIVITIPALKKDYTVEVVWKTASGSDYTRYLTTTNLSNISKFDAVTDQTGTPGDDVDKNDQNGTGTVTTDGDVTLKSTVGGVNITSITVKDENGTVLTKDQVVSGSGSQGGGSQGSSNTVWDFAGLTTGTEYSATENLNNLYLQLKSGHKMTVEDVASSQKTFTLSNGTELNMTHKITLEGAATESSDPIEGAMGTRRVAATGMNLDYMALDVTEAGTLYVVARANDNNSARETRLGFQKEDKSYSVLSKSEAKKDLVELKGEVTEAGTFFIYGSIKMSVQTVVWVPSGSASGISVVTATKADGKWYNLQGQEVTAPTKGIFIKDGKKYVIK